MLAGLPAVFLFVFGNRFFCSYFAEVLVATLLITVGVTYLLWKSKHRKKLATVMFILLVGSYLQVTFFYPYVDRCMSKESFRPAAPPDQTLNRNSMISPSRTT